MSMMGRFVEVSDTDLEALIDDPDAAPDLFMHDSLRSNEATGVSSPSAPLATLDVDKAWHGLHYVLTGSEWDTDSVLGRMILGGTELGEDELGYGPARYLTPDEVSQSSSALAELIGTADPMARFDPAQMSSLSIYPGHWVDDDRAWLEDAVARMTSFFTDAAARGSAVVACLV
jgi:hypothetical protein